MERQAEDGTFYRSVGQDQWSPVTREAQDGTIYKKVGEEQWSPIQSSQPSPTTPQQDRNALVGNLRTGNRSILSSITLGASEPVMGAMHSVNKTFDQGVDAVDAKLHGKETDFSLVNNLKKNYDEDVAQRRQDKADYRPADIGGTIVGALMPGPGNALVKGVGKFVGRGAAGVAEELPAVLTGSALAKGAGKIAKSYVEGAGIAAASGGIQQQFEGAGGYLKPEEKASIVDLAKTGGKWGAALSALPQAYKLAKYAATNGGKAAMSVLLGPKIETIDAYLANADRINKAKSVEDLKTEIDKTVGQLAADVENKKLSVDDANKVLDGIHDKVKDTRKAADRNFDLEQHSLRSEIQDAKDKLADTVNARKQSLQAVPPPLHIAGDVQQSIASLKDQVSKGSGAAFDLLDTNAKISKYDIFHKLRNLRSGLNVAGSNPPPESGAGAIDGLLKYVDDLPGEISPKDAKQLIMHIDNTEKVNYANGTMNDAVGDAFKIVRQGLDAQVKKNPEYAAHMGGLAEKTGILKQALDRFGNVNTLLSKLKNIHAETNANDRALLEKLGQLTGNDLSTAVNDYAEAQAKLSPEKMRQFQNTVPEAERVSKLESQSQRVRHPDYYDNRINQAVEGAGLPQQISDQEALVQQRQAGLEKSKSALEPFQSLSNPQTTQSKIESLMRDNPKNSIETRKMMSNLDQSTGKNFSQDINDRRVLDSFEKGNTNGSRNVNLFSIFGHSIGAATGGLAAAGGAVAGPIGLFVGAATGAIVDKYGPKMAKGILDATLAIEGTPTLQKIKALNLPPDVKDYLALQLIRHQADLVKNGQLGRVADSKDKKPDQAPIKGPDKWMNSGIDKLKEHDGSFSDADLQSLKKTRKGLELLYRASDLKPNTKAMDDIQQQILRLNADKGTSALNVAN